MLRVDIALRPPPPSLALSPQNVGEEHDTSNASTLEQFKSLGVQAVELNNSFRKQRVTPACPLRGVLRPVFAM